MPITTQLQLERALNCLFPDVKIWQNVRRLSSLVDTGTNHYIELDFWIPDLHLAFEFQDSYHYVTSLQCQTHSLDFVQHRDKLKKELVEAKGDTLVCVPYWWDGTIESLAATLQEQLPRFSLGTNNTPIENLPSLYFDTRKAIPQIGELMLPSSAFSLDNVHEGWIAEYHDGIQVAWHPEIKKLYSKKGNNISFAMANIMPRNFIDGTLWFGRNSQNINDAFLRFLVVDCPDPLLSCNPFEHRFAILLQSIPNSTFLIPNVNVGWSTRLTSVKKFLELVAQAGINECVLRTKGSLYLQGISSDFCKVSIEILSAKIGRKEEIEKKAHGYWTINASENIRNFFDDFAKKRGLDPQVAENWYEITADEIYACQGGASVLRVYGHSLKRALNDVYPNIGLRDEKFYPTKYGINLSSIQSRKDFFDEFGKSNGFEPLIPSNWYSITVSQISSTSAGVSIMNFYGHSLVRALKDVYPQLLFNISCFNKPRKYWLECTNKRRLFDSFASYHGFEPMDARNWSQIPRSVLVKFKGVRSVLQQHNGSILHALANVYPDASFDNESFVS